MLHWFYATLCDSATHFYMLNRNSRSVSTVMSFGKRKVAGNDWHMTRPSLAGTWNDIEQMRVPLEYHPIRAIQHNFQKS